MSLAKARDVAVGVGLLVSGGLWLAYVRFYSELGLAPGDVGIGFGQVLERSIGAVALTIVLLALVTVFVIMCMAPLVSLLWRPKAPVDRLARVERRGAAQVRAGQRVLSGWLMLVFVPPILVAALAGDAQTLLSLAVVTVGVVLFARVAVIVVDADASRVAVAVLTVAASVGACALFLVEATSTAHQIKRGAAVEGEFLGVTTFGIRARPTDVELDGAKRCVLYLGTADGVTVLYDPETDRVERVPSGDLRVTLDPDRQRCG